MVRSGENTGEWPGERSSCLGGQQPSVMVPLSPEENRAMLQGIRRRQI